MNYRVIALDLDGTLLNDNKTILPQSVDALAQARQQGFQVLIVTGRHHTAIQPFYQQLQLDTPTICCNGSYIYNFHQQSVSAANPLEKQQALHIIELLQEYQVNSLLYADDAMIYQKPSEHSTRMLNWSTTLAEEVRPTIIQVDSMQQAAIEAGSIWKFAVSYQQLDTLRHFSDRVEQDLGLVSEWSWHDQIDIAQHGSSKGKMLTEWVTSQGLTMQQVVAFGDNFNDLSMLQSVGLGVAMGNSETDIQQQADVVIGSNEEPSIANFLQQHILAN